MDSPQREKRRKQTVDVNFRDRHRSLFLLGISLLCDAARNMGKVQFYSRPSTTLAASFLRLNAPG
jgi:hypothetical protein